MFVFMATSFIKALGLNTIIMNQIGEEGMAVFTVCDNVLLIVEMLTGGIIGVIPNVAGILFGEKDLCGNPCPLQKDAQIQLHSAGCYIRLYNVVYCADYNSVWKRRRGA